MLELETQAVLLDLAGIGFGGALTLSFLRLVAVAIELVVIVVVDAFGATNWVLGPAVAIKSVVIDGANAFGVTNLVLELGTEAIAIGIGVGGLHTLFFARTANNQRKKTSLKKINAKTCVSNDCINF